MSEEYYLTKEGAEKMRAELEDMLVNQRMELSERLRTAIQQGDLSENADYHKAKEDQALKVVDDQVGSPTYTKDLALALKRLVEFGDISKSEIYHVSNTGDCSWYAFARKILLFAEGTEEIKLEPIKSSELARAANRPKYSVLDTGKFEKRTGQKMRSWEEALGEFISKG